MVAVDEWGFGGRGVQTGLTVTHSSRGNISVFQNSLDQDFALLQADIKQWGEGNVTRLQF